MQAPAFGPAVQVVPDVTGRARFPDGDAYLALSRVELYRMPTDLHGSPSRGTGLVDVLDRVLDKGLVVAGDIKVSLAEVELLTIRIRLLICSIDKAEQIGLDWWKYDRHLSPGREEVMQENLALREQLRLLERRLTALTRASGRRARSAGGARD